MAGESGSTSDATKVLLYPGVWVFNDIVFVTHYSLFVDDYRKAIANG